MNVAAFVRLGFGGETPPPSIVRIEGMDDGSLQLQFDTILQGTVQPQDALPHANVAFRSASIPSEKVLSIEYDVDASPSAPEGGGASTLPSDPLPTAPVVSAADIDVPPSAPTGGASRL